MARIGGGIDPAGQPTLSAALDAGPALANTFNVFNQLTDTLIGGATTLTSTDADTSNTERLTAGATSFLNGTLGVTSQTTSGATISYIRDPSGHLIAMRTAGQFCHYTTDKQGSVIALTDSTQALAATYAYGPWGNTTSTGSLAATNPSSCGTIDVALNSTVTCSADRSACGTQRVSLKGASHSNSPVWSESQ